MFSIFNFRKKGVYIFRKMVLIRKTISRTSWEYSENFIRVDKLLGYRRYRPIAAHSHENIHLVHIIFYERKSVLY